MSKIASPQTTPDHPDHLLNCEEAIDYACRWPLPPRDIMLKAAIAAGWDEPTVVAALANLQRVEPFTAED